MGPERDRVGLRLAAAHRRVDRLLNRALQPTGIGAAHAQILLCVLEADELRVAQVADRTGFEASTVSRLVAELGRRKLIRRRRDPDDGRALLVSPAKRGRALRVEIELVLRRAHDRAFGGVTEADLEGFVRTIETLDRLP